MWRLPGWQVGEEYVLTIRDPTSVGAMAIGVSYDAFVDDVEVHAHLAHAWRSSLRNPLPNINYVQRGGHQHAVKSDLLPSQHISTSHVPVMPSTRIVSCLIRNQGSVLAAGGSGGGGRRHGEPGD